MAAIRNNVRFNLNNIHNAKGNIENNEPLHDGRNGQQQMLQFAIPESVDQETANLLNMLMTMMQTLMEQMEIIYQANQFILETQLDYERWKWLVLAKQLKNQDNNGPKIVGKAPKFDLQKDRDNFKTWKI